MAALARTGATLPDIRRYSSLPRVDAPYWDRWVRERFRYRREVHEIIRTVNRMLWDLNHTGKIEGDCDDIATFHASVLHAAGMEPQLIAIRMQGEREFSHVFCRAHGFVFDPVVPIGTAFPDVAETLIEVL